MINSRFFSNPYTAYLAFLVLYCVYIFFLHEDKFTGDEEMYFIYASNLLKGFYSPPSPDFYIGFGPGYPLLLAPFIGLKLPMIVIPLLNGLFQYLSIVFLYKSLMYHVSHKLALLVGYFWACYYNTFEYLHLAVPEAFPTFLLVILSYKITLICSSDDKKLGQVVAAGIILGSLILTKVIFGYVLLFGTIILISSLFFSRNKMKLYRILYILLISYLVITPYLTYTFRTTGHLFYFATVGGNNMYWMSSPFPKEHGSWFPFHRADIDSVQLNINSSREIDFKNNHKEVFTKIEKLSGVQRDSVFKSEAINNIMANPLKFGQNCISNVGRLFFNFPYSYTYQTPNTLLRLPLSGIVVLLSLFSLIPTFINWKKIPLNVKTILVMAFLYFGGSILGSAETRMFTVIVPLLLYWISYILYNTMKIKIKF